MPSDAPSPSPYDTPTSTPDPYALPTPISFPSTTTLPSVLPLFGPLTGYTTARQQTLIEKQITQTSQSIHRPLTEPERSAIAYHAAKGLAISSYGPTIGIAGGLYRTYVTRAEFRLPFQGLTGKILSPEPPEGEVQRGFWDGRKMRVGGKEILQGVSSQAKANMLHVARGMAYCALGAMLVPLFVSSYAATVTAVGQIQDPRLQDANRRLREAIEREQRQRGERAGDIVKQADARREGRMQGLPRERDQGRGRRGGGAEVDDASPTGGAMLDMGIDEEQGRLGGPGDMSGVLSDGQMRSAEAKARPAAGQNPAGNRAPTFQMDKMERQPKDFASDFGSDFDDASPTGGSRAMDGDGGSVWERIRQQSVSEPSRSSTGRSTGIRGRGARQEQEEGETLGDSFSFSSSDEEKGYAKAEAQKEFDERVEKERRGGDFGGDGRRRW
ncbi:hypothetical protein BDR22DRAFT_969841 [Usnea florida]